MVTVPTTSKLHLACLTATVTLDCTYTICSCAMRRMSANGVLVPGAKTYHQWEICSPPRYLACTNRSDRMRLRDSISTLQGNRIPRDLPATFPTKPFCLSLTVCDIQSTRLPRPSFETFAGFERSTRKHSCRYEGRHTAYGQLDITRGRQCGQCMAISQQVA